MAVLFEVATPAACSCDCPVTEARLKLLNPPPVKLGPFVVLAVIEPVTGAVPPKPIDTALPFCGSGSAEVM